MTLSSAIRSQCGKLPTGSKLLWTCVVQGKTLPVGRGWVKFEEGQWVIWSSSEKVEWVDHFIFSFFSRKGGERRWHYKPNLLDFLFA